MAMGARKRRRIQLIAFGGVALAAATTLAAIAFNDAIVFFFSPTDLIAKAEAGEIKPDHRVRLGGLIARNSVSYAADGVLEFIVEDGGGAVPVRFDGVPPDLFREGQGVVAIGFFRESQFEAAQILAKHDEQYKPPEVVDALKKNGHWKAQEN